jgi:hypothetical protein
VPKSSGVTLIQFSEFSLEQGYDVLYVYDVDVPSSPRRLAELSGPTMPQPIRATARLKIEFVTDGSVEAAGFTAVISVQSGSTRAWDGTGVDPDARTHASIRGGTVKPSSRLDVVVSAASPNGWPAELMAGLAAVAAVAAIALSIAYRFRNHSAAVHQDVTCQTVGREAENNRIECAEHMTTTSTG